MAEVFSIQDIAAKIEEGLRISDEDALLLFRSSDLALLGRLASLVRQRKNGNVAFFNRNFHIEPTNVCVFDCKFCSYSRLLKQKEGQWELTQDQMMDLVRKYDRLPVTEVHIVGGVHPKMDLKFFGELLASIRKHRPTLHIKAFTAVELDYMFRKAGVSIREGLQFLKDHGLNSLPGGGAEIFNEKVRVKISEDKCDADRWLEIHETAHTLGIPSNATILYGHVESYEDRVDHMRRLRELQDRTHGFNTFIPLKFRNKDNQMSAVPEVSLAEDMKNYAVSRLYLDNFAHVKSYWPMLGRANTQLSLAFGVDDIDGTIDDSTKIYTMAGSEEQTPAMSTPELISLVKTAGRIPVERDTLYNIIQSFN